MPLDHASVRSLTGLIGPWFVLDKKVPTGPGMSWTRLVSLIEKGRVTAGTVIRGPSTEGLWMPAGRAPLVAKQLGLCWSCQAALPPDDRLQKCPQCGRALNGSADGPESQSAGSQAGEPIVAAQDDGEVPGAIDQLIQAGASNSRGRGYARRHAGSNLAGLILALLAAVLVGGGATFAVMMVLDKPGTPVPTDLTPQWTGPEPPPRAAPEPEGPLGSGELFPEVPTDTRLPASNTTTPKPDPAGGNASTTPAARPAPPSE